MYKI
ncbi:hypothetical protein, partial [Plasmodium yoelii yoelii]|jgi:hypothetical protein